MATIKFSSEKLSEEILFTTEPVINITNIQFSTDDKEWIARLLTTNLLVKLSGLNEDNLPVFSNQEFLVLNITPYHIYPVFEVNRFFRLSDDFKPFQSNVAKWKVEVVVNNVEFKKGESLLVSYMDQDYVKQRVIDWAKRVHELIIMLSDWAAEYDSVQVRFSRMMPMHEGLMKDFKIPMLNMETADVVKKGKIVMAIKPFGLWIMGANGRVDLLTAKGNYILVDDAERFNSPIWKIYLTNEKSKGVLFNKEIFKQLIGV